MKEVTEQILAAQRDMILQAILDHPSPQLASLEKMAYEKARMEIYQLVIGQKFDPRER